MIEDPPIDEKVPDEGRQECQFRIGPDPEIHRFQREQLGFAKPLGQRRDAAAVGILGLGETGIKKEAGVEDPFGKGVGVGNEVWPRREGVP